MVKDSLNSTSLIFYHSKKIRSGLSIAIYLSAFIKDFNWGPVRRRFDEGASNCFPYGQRDSLMISHWILVGNLKALLFTIQISSDFFKGEFSGQIFGMGDFILIVKMTELAL